VRGRFVDLVERQIALFTAENEGLIRDTEAALVAYNRAPRDEAEERYGDYVDVVETVTEALADMRDRYARTLDESGAEEYEAAFNRAVQKRWPPFGLEIENR
jgi:hypothetical protein